MPSFQSYEFPHQKLFFDPKDKNYKKTKDERSARLDEKYRE